MPPLIDDFIYICENAFTREDIIKMEMDVFRVIGFNLGIPLSYRYIDNFKLMKLGQEKINMNFFLLKI